MNMKFVIFVILIVVCEFNLIRSQPCPKYLSVNITDGLVINNSLIQKNGVVYNDKNYYKINTEIFGCICNIKKCVRKCCENNQMIIENICQNRNLSFEVKTYNNTTVSNRKLVGDFYMIYGKNCSNGYDQIRAYEPVFLQNDGSLFYKEFDYSAFYGVEDYCIDNFDGEEISAYLCEVEEPQAEHIIKGHDPIPDWHIENYFIITGTSCPEQHFSILPDSNSDVFLQEDGSLYNANWDVIYSVSEYCVDIIDNELSALVCEYYEEDQMAETVHTTGMIISMPFLLITFVVYLLLPERNVHRRALMSYVFTLLAAYVTLVTIQLYTGQFPDVPCHVLGHLIIFFFLVSFFWMNVMCIDMWLAFSGMRAFLGKQDAEKKRFIIYCIYAWGMPTVHTLMVFLINQYGDPNSGYHPEIGKRRCFLGEELPTFYYFYLPMAILIGINIVLFILTTIRIQQIKKETSMLKHSDSNRHSYEDDKQKFNLYLKLMFAMGVNWIMELVSWLVDWVIKDTPTFVWYLTDFTNAMYGVLIFLIFVFKKKIWRSLKKRYYVLMGKPHLAHSMTTSSARGTRTSNYSTTETGVSTDYRLHDIRNGKPEETALTRP